MESLQQATDGDGQRRNARRYRESNVTLRRYIEDKRGQETSWWEALLVIKARSAAAVRAAQPETNGGPKKGPHLMQRLQCAFVQQRAAPVVRSGRRPPAALLISVSLLSLRILTGFDAVFHFLFFLFFFNSFKWLLKQKQTKLFS